MRFLPKPTCSLPPSVWCLLVVLLQVSQVSLQSSWEKGALLNPFSKDELLKVLLSKKIIPIGQDSKINGGNTNREPFPRHRIKYILKKDESGYHNVFIRELQETPAGSDDIGSGSAVDPPLNTCNTSNFCTPDIDSQYLWPLTHAADVQFGRCFGNTAPATRICLSDCEWDQVNCSVSDELQNVLQLLNYQDVSDAVQELVAITRHVQRSPEPLSEVYLMQRILSQAINEQKRVSQMFQQNFLSICSHILDPNYRERSVNIISEINRYRAGTWLLQTMNEFGLSGINVTEETSLTGSQTNIKMRVLEPVTSILAESNDSVLVICDGNSSVLIGHGVYTTLTNFNESTIASFVYANMTGFLPERRQNSSDVKLVAPIISSDVRCGEGECNFPDNNTMFNIVITFFHSVNLLEELDTSGTVSETICVYWETPNTRNDTGEEDAPFNHGRWSDASCNKNNGLSNLSFTVCECYSFGVFAVVLNQADKRSQLISDENKLALNIIYSIGTSFSLLGLIFTACVFIGFKSLWSLQSCVHIQLCLILSLVVLSFAVGGEQFMNNVTLCATFAVLKHYLLLVALMWILIDGIVLLILSTVTTFSFKLRYYLVGFTILAYGIPLLYMCLCLPLGFQLWNEEMRGYGEPYGCFLRLETNFFISFLVPVIVLLMVSTIVFVVALTISSSQHCKQKELSGSSFYPLVTYASLLTYVGFTCLILSFSNITALLYLSTILISFQGFFVFVLYVPCSKQVRELLRQKFVKSKLLYTIRRFEEPPTSDHSMEAQKLSKTKLSKSVRTSARTSMYEPSDEVHCNPLAVSQEMDEKDIQPANQQHSMKTKTAVNPSDVSLWRLADRALNKTNLQLEPTIEELEEKATVVTFL